MTVPYFVIFSFVSLFLFLFLLIAIHFNYLIPINMLADKFPNLSYEIISLISFFGSPLFVSILLFLILFLRNKESEILSLWILGIGAGMQFTIKRMLAFERPVGSILTTPGFPSGHSFYSALVYWSLAGLLWKNSRAVSLTLIAIPFIIGFTRLYLGVHWLSDVIGGLLFGAVWVFLFLHKVNKN